MADSRVGIALILSASDRASAVIHKLTQGAIKELDSLQSKSAKIADQSFRTGQQLIAAGLAVGAPLYAAKDAAVEFETKMVDIRKQITALDDPKELRAMQKEIIQLGRELPIPINEIQDLIAAGARMDIPRNELIGYTREVTKMAVAFDLAAGTIGEDMGKIAKVFNQPIREVGAMADAINYLDDNAISKGGEIIDVLQRIGGTAKYLKFEEAAALSSTFLTLAETPERAASGINELIVTLSAAAAQSKKARGAFAAIGLNPEAVQKRFVTDAQGTIMDVLQRINKVKPEHQNTVLAQLFGQEHIGKISKLANSFKEYERQLAMVKGQQKGSMDREYSKRIASTGAQETIANNNRKTTAILIGTVILPAYNKLLSKMGALSIKLSAFTEKHPRLIKWLVYGAAAFSALALAGGYLSFVVGGIARSYSLLMGASSMVFKGVKALQFGIFALRFGFVTKLMPAIKGAMIAFRAFGLSLLTNPLTLYIAAAVALAAIVYLVIRNWDKIRIFFSKLWTATKVIFKAGWEWIKKMFLNYTPHGLIIKHWDKIGAFFSGLWDNVKNIFKGYISWVFGLGKIFVNAGKNIVKSIWEGIKSMASKPVEAIKAIVKKIRDFLPFSPAKVGPLRDIHRIKLVETIAASIKPGSLINAMDRTLSTFTTSIRKTSPIPLGAVHGGVIQFNYNPNIYLSGTATRDDANKLAGMGMAEFKRMMKQYQAEQSRTSYND